MNRFFALALCALSLISCSKTDNPVIPAPEYSNTKSVLHPNDILPLSAGNKWLYSYNNSTTHVVLGSPVTDIYKRDNSNITTTYYPCSHNLSAIVQVGFINPAANEKIFLLNADTVGTKYTQSDLIKFTFPLTIKSLGKTTINPDISITVSFVPSITVSAGTFDCYKLHYVDNFSRDSADTYWSKGIGLIKTDYLRGNHSEELKSFNVQ